MSSGSVGARSAPRSPVPVVYTGRDAVRVRGTATGRPYEFSASAPTAAVAESDLAGLLRTGLFRRGR